MPHARQSSPFLPASALASPSPLNLWPRVLGRWLPRVGRSFLTQAADGEGGGEVGSALPARCRLVVAGYGATVCHWSIHAWLQRCPLPPDFQIVEEDGADPIGLHLQPVALTRERGELERLRQLPCVLDPVPHRVETLCGLGVAAVWLDPQASSSGWLDADYDPAQVCRLFGLPDPEVLRAQGLRLCLGSAGDSWEHQLQPPNWALPGFADLYVPDAPAARLLAGWLNACNRSGLQLIRLNPTDYELDSQPFDALDRPQDVEAGEWIPPLMLTGPMDAQGLEDEISLAYSGGITSPECPTPAPSHHVIWESEASAPAEADRTATAAICVSLYNYEARIIGALDSARQQTHADLELIIVDDASTDSGCEKVLEWLKLHGHRFVRTCLLQHTTNSGLAAARNTAFSAAQSEWCFVLDADNGLEPEAVSLCLAIAHRCPSDTAVVHPLVELRNEASLPGQPQQALLSRIPWQRHALQHGNQIDAMAMIRRQHWQAVGGFTHIPCGWEDYDFWCKLIDAGFHGVICPQRLAIYNRHSISMQATSTLGSLRKLSRLLQARHPWLQLDMRYQS